LFFIGELYLLGFACMIQLYTSYDCVIVFLVSRMILKNSPVGKIAGKISSLCIFDNMALIFWRFCPLGG